MLNGRYFEKKLQWRFSSWMTFKKEGRKINLEEWLCIFWRKYGSKRQMGPHSQGKHGCISQVGPKHGSLWQMGSNHGFLGRMGLRFPTTNMDSHVPLLLKANHVSQGTLGPFPNSIWKIKFQFPIFFTKLPSTPFCFSNSTKEVGPNCPRIWELCPVNT
jgi:hypothetical protein